MESPDPIATNQRNPGELHACCPVTWKIVPNRCPASAHTPQKLKSLTKQHHLFFTVCVYLVVFFASPEPRYVRRKVVGCEMLPADQRGVVRPELCLTQWYRWQKGPHPTWSSRSFRADV
jgi:hypothetical protein